MSNNDIDERVFDAFREQFYDTQLLDNLSLETKLADFAADSLDLVELICSLEAEFDINVEDKMVQQWQTLEDCVAYINVNVAPDEHD